MDSGHLTHQAIEDARGKRFCDGIESWVFPTRNQVISLIEFLKKAGDLFRIILQIAIHRKDDVSTTTAKTCHQRGSLAKVPAEANHAHCIRIRGMQYFQFCKCFVGATIINKYYLVALSKSIELRG